MTEGWRGRARVALIILLTFVCATFWVFLFMRHPAKSTYVSRVTGTGLPPLSMPTPVPSLPTSASGPAAIELPTVSGRALLLSIVGDSLATGHFASGPKTRYRALIISALQARGSVTAVEATTPAASTLSTTVTVPGGLDLVVLELGTDDLSRTTVAAFTSSYGALVSSVRKSSPHAALVCAGTWSALGAVFDAVIQRDCVAARGHFVSLASLFANPADRGPAGVAGYYGISDDVAPNDAGHRAIAGALLAAIGVPLH